MVSNKTCCVTGCKTAIKTALFFKVPAVRSLRRRWTDAIKPPTTITLDSYICNAHFLTTDYETVRGKTRLKRKVVPSIFENGDSMKTSNLKDKSTAKLLKDIESSPKVAKTADNGAYIEDLDTSVSHTEVSDTGVSDIGVSDTGVSNTAVSDTGVSNAVVSDNGVSNTEVTDKGVSNTEITDKGVSNTDNLETDVSETRDIDKHIESIGDSNDKIKEVENDDLRNRSLKSKEKTSKINKTKSDTNCTSAKAREDDIVVLDDQTGALTDSAGAAISVPCTVSNERAVTPDKCIWKKYYVDAVFCEVEVLPARVLSPTHLSPEPHLLVSSSAGCTACRTPFKPISPTPDMNKDDIEEILTNYHIKQTKPLHETYEEIYPDEEVVDLANVPEAQPVFIEISVDKDRSADASAGDCLMLLESVQVDIDPSSLMLPERIIEEVDGIIGDDDDDDDVQETNKKKEDPISLLTSSDEDDVIIEEPNIDTVEVSDETDEDDVPLVKLLNSTKDKKKKKKMKRGSIGSILWGVCDYYCIECHFRTFNKGEFDNHKKQHSTVLQICQLCGYTTASEAQFSRHKKKHKEEKKFKCHLCDYKARHNMSLIYHLRTHNEAISKSKKGLKCNCGFKSTSNSKIMKHLKVCAKKYSCDKCSYGTKRKTDLERHKMRRHKSDDDDDDEEYPASWACE